MSSDNNTNNQPKLSIIVPAYNELPFIGDSIFEILMAGEESGLTYEIIIVDDGSTDGSQVLIDKIAAKHDQVTAIHHDKNMGLGYAYKSGLSLAQGEYVTWAPADHSHPKAGLLDVYKCIGEEDILLPIPTNREVRPLHRRLISSLYTWLVNISFGQRVPYYNGLAVHRTELLRGLKIDTNGFAFQAEIIIKLLKNGHKYKVIPVEIADRDNGRSKALQLSSVLRMTKDYFSLLFAV